MTKPLSERFAGAKNVLDSVVTALGSGAGLPVAVASQFRDLTKCRVEIDKLADMVEARSLAWSLLVGLEDRADSDSWVTIGTAKAKFHHVRLLGVQAYLAATWSLVCSKKGTP